MKKLVYSAFIALVALWSVSCNKELKPEGTVNPAQKAEKVKMTFTAGIQTKAFVEDGASSVDIKWDAEDHIAVWDGTEWCDFSAKSVNGSTAVFEGEITRNEAFATTDFKAVYPFAAITDPSSEAISITVPSAQVVPSGGFVDPSALVSVATCSAEGLLSFAQVCALVKINLTLSGMSAITLEGTGLAGTVVCASDGSVSSSSSLENTITLSSADGTFSAAADYFIAVLPGTSAPLKVGMVRESDGYTGVRSASSVTFAQGKAKVYIKDSAISEWEYNIYTPEQLVNCASRWSEGFTSTVNICADLDMDGISWNGSKNFAGTMNGGNHKIYNLVVEKDTDPCFIRNLVGEMNNLCLGSSDGINYDGTSSITLDSTGGSGSWFYAAPVIRLKTPAKMENITNFIPVTVTAATNVKTRVSGLVATVTATETAGPVTIINCTNYADVTNNATALTTAASTHMAGILGPMDAAGTLENVTNKGNIICSSKYVSWIGGICSLIFGGSTFTNCDNYGKITMGDLALYATTFVGGIAFSGSSATQYANKSTLTGCDNHGDFVGGRTSGKTLEVGGICGWMRNVELKNCDNYGNITSSHYATGRFGGIIGSIHASGIVSGCDNSGNITISNTTANTGWFGIGGVAGFSEGTPAGSVTNCSNSGAVAATLNATGASYCRISVGGIIGMAYTNLTLVDNINRGPVTAENTHASSPYCQLGGIMGSDADSTSATYANGDCTVSGNVNYGKVTQNTAGAAYAYTGGLFGKLIFTTSVSGCKNFGFVDGTNAGAVAGYNKQAGISATICDAVEVNGVTKAAATDEAAWLCPSNTGTITPTYVAHSSSE